MKIGGGARSLYAKRLFIDGQAMEVNRLLALMMMEW